MLGMHKQTHTPGPCTQWVCLVTQGREREFHSVGGLGSSSSSSFRPTSRQEEFRSGWFCEILSQVIIHNSAICSVKCFLSFLPGISLLMINDLLDIHFDPVCFKGRHV